MEGGMSRDRLVALGLLPAPVEPPKIKSRRILPPLCEYLYIRFPVKRYGRKKK
jgi:hypothetical protein